MRFLLGAIAVLMLACLAFGQSVKLPAEIKGEPGEFIAVKADTLDKQVKWRAVDRGLNLIPVELLKDSKTCIASALRPGRYRLIAWSAKADVPSDLAECIVIIGEVPPDPGPGPKPPDPPVPVPPDDDGRLGLVKASRVGLAAVTLVNKAATAKAVAASNRTLASKIAAGGVTEPATILAEWRATNRAAVGDQPAPAPAPNSVVWQPWGNVVSEALATLHKSGKLLTKSDWADAFNEIAKGLEQ